MIAQLPVERMAVSLCTRPFHYPLRCHEYSQKTEIPAIEITIQKTGKNNLCIAGPGEHFRAFILQRKNHGAKEKTKREVHSFKTPDP